MKKVNFLCPGFCTTDQLHWQRLFINFYSFGKRVKINDSCTVNLYSSFFKQIFYFSCQKISVNLFQIIIISVLFYPKFVHN